MPEILDRRVSFNGGELSPWTDPRIDLEKYRTACRTMENIRPTVYGGAFSRPGTVFIGEAADPDFPHRLVEFEFSVTTTFILEFGQYTLRFWTTGDTPGLVLDPTDDPLVLATPWTAAEAFELQFSQQNDVVFIVHPSHAPLTLSRFSNSDWQLTPLRLRWPATLDENLTTTTIAITGASTATPGTQTAWASGTYAVGAKVTHSAVDYVCIAAVDGYVSTLAPGSWSGWETYWSRLDVSRALGIGQAVTLTASSALFSADHIGSRWLVNHIRETPAAAFSINTAVNGDTTTSLFVLGERSASMRSDSDGSGDWSVIVAVERSYDLLTWETRRTITGTKSEVQALLTGTELEPCWIRLKLQSKSGTIPSQYRAEIEAVDPYHYGIVQITARASSTSATAILLFPVSTTTATTRWNEAAWSDYRGWPRSVAIHEARLFFGGTTHKPQTVWGSVIDDYSSYRIGADDDLGLAITLASDAANGVQWLVSQESLVIGTTGSEWIFGARASDRTLTATNAAVKRNTSFGSAYIQARAVHDATLFVQRSARKVREFVYTFEKDGFSAQDLTMLAEHITAGRILQITIQRNPETVLWAVTGDGALIGLTYERGQNVAGWFRFETDGAFESIAVVSGTGEEDEVWVAVNRTIDGDTVRYVERFQLDQIRALKEDRQEDLVCVDSAVVYDGAPITTITGLDHLEACEVSILADGAPHPARTVLGGEIELQLEASKVAVGLAFTATIEPTFLETGDPGSLSKAGVKRLHRVIAEVWKTLGMEVSGDAGATWSRIEFRTPGNDMDAAPPLFTGIIEEHLEGSSQRQSTAIIRQRQPLPLNIMSLTFRYELNAL
jgi:hypothetical protein